MNGKMGRCLWSSHYEVYFHYKSTNILPSLLLPSGGTAHRLEVLTLDSGERPQLHRTVHLRTLSTVALADLTGNSNSRKRSWRVSQPCCKGGPRLGFPGLGCLCFFVEHIIVPWQYVINNYYSYYSLNKLLQSVEAICNVAK